MSPKKPAPKRKRPQTPLDWAPEELDAIKKKAHAAGLPVATWIKSRVYTHPEGIPMAHRKR